MSETNGAAASVRHASVPAVRPGQKPGRNFKNSYFPRGRRKPQTRAEIEQNRRMIEAFIAEKGVKVCPPGIASGAVQTQYEFI